MSARGDGRVTGILSARAPRSSPSSRRPCSRRRPCSERSPHARPSGRRTPHAPNEPTARFVDHPACADVEPWAAPSYNEADVSDKPAYIRSADLRPEASYDLRTRCEETMTVDWAVAEVSAALEDAGRLDDTLLVFTADNGYLLGDHRLED